MLLSFSSQVNGLNNSDAVTEDSWHPFLCGVLDGHWFLFMECIFFIIFVLVVMIVKSKTEHEQLACWIFTSIR